MSEKEPTQYLNVESGEKLEEPLTEEGARNLSLVCERLISGKPVEPTSDYKTLRERMWQDTRAAYLNEVIPNLKHFRRNPELERVVLSAPSGSQERANAELELVNNYIQQLKDEETSSIGTTPVLSREHNWKLNCVSKSVVAAVILEELGMKTKSGIVHGHVVLVFKNSAGKLIYADPNGIVGEIHPATEKRDEVTLHTLSIEDQGDLGIPYSRIVTTDQKIGFLEAMFGNLDKAIAREQGKEYLQALERHGDTVELLEKKEGTSPRDKLFPEMAVVHEEVEKDKDIVGADEAFMDTVLQKALGEDVSEEEKRRLIKHSIEESLACEDKESFLRFLAGESDLTLPEGFSHESTNLFNHIKQGLNELKGNNDRLRNIILRRITKSLHPQP